MERKSHKTFRELPHALAAFKNFGRFGGETDPTVAEWLDQLRHTLDTVSSDVIITPPTL
ncbi:MAG: hypothetical protein DDT39_00009 [Firmicutes bacterium]|nr:hypothetical protein [candidate division NPL-UPA2 bacterium]